MQATIYTVDDSRVNDLLDVLNFFDDWEKELTNLKEQVKYRINTKTRQNIDTCIYCSVELLKVAQKFKIAITPGYINSYLIENWFCQHRCLRNGFNQNKTLYQIAGATI